MIPGTVLTLRVEKPAAGGRMIARHEGMVVLVAGAIPGEAVRARVERADRSMAYALVTEVIEAHPARREVACDARCGGAVYAHIESAQQRILKGQVVQDALRRVARVPWGEQVPVTASPERGYRMRARLHARDGRVGFFLEGTHQLCDAMGTGQLLDAAGPALDGVAAELRHAGLSGDADIELSENIAGDERAVHVEFEPGASVRSRDLRLTMAGVTGLSWSTRGTPGERVVAGEPGVVDVIESGGPDSSEPLRLRRHVRAFFQGNRFLLRPLVGTIVASCPPGSVVDLYAGVGLFGVALAATGRHQVTAVEGHHASARDLRANAAPYGAAITVHESSVERFLSQSGSRRPSTLVLDPPRSGMTRDAVTGAVALGAGRVVFVSCDVATFARDVRAFVDAGYRLTRVEAYDLFPNTAHVEVVAELVREADTVLAPRNEA